MEISFVNKESFPCGCKAEYDSGGGMYSAVISIVLCKEHSPDQSPKQDALNNGYIQVADGSWIQQCNE